MVMKKFFLHKGEPVALYRVRSRILVEDIVVTRTVHSPALKYQIYNFVKQINQNSRKIVGKIYYIFYM